ISFELKARRVGTILHSSFHRGIEIQEAQGTILAASDATHSDTRTKLVFTPQIDRDDVLRVRALNSKGGDPAVYYIEADWARPDFTVRCDPDKAMIGPGSSTAWYVHVVRSNGFAGPVDVQVKGLPKGMSASPLTIPPSMTQ